MKHHINGVHHVSVSVPDIDTARRFYIELLGADEVFTGEWEPGNAWIDAIVGIEDSAAKSFMARLKNIYVEVFEYVSPKSPPQDPARQLHLQRTPLQRDVVLKVALESRSRSHATVVEVGGTPACERKLI